MKIIKLFSVLFLGALLNTTCAPHCDDEDYNRDQKEAVITQTYSLAVSVQ